MTTVPIRLPNRDNVAIVEELPDSGVIEQFLFNDIGGTELINLVRNDSVSGLNIKYSIISDLSQVTLEMNPTDILFGKGLYEGIFDTFGIKLSSKIPTDDYYLSNEVIPNSNVGTNVYYDGENLIIEFINISPEEFAEVQVMSNATIYTMRENDY